MAMGLGLSASSRRRSRKFLAFVGVVVALGTPRVFRGLLVFLSRLFPVFFHFPFTNRQRCSCALAMQLERAGRDGIGKFPFGDNLILFPHLPPSPNSHLYVRKRGVAAFDICLFFLVVWDRWSRKKRERGKLCLVGWKRATAKKKSTTTTTNRVFACPGALSSFALFSFCRGPGLASRVV